MPGLLVSVEHWSKKLWHPDFGEGKERRRTAGLPAGIYSGGSLARLPRCVSDPFRLSGARLGHVFTGGILVDPASSHMLVSKIKPCMSKFTPLYGETANGSLNQSRFLR